MEGQESYNYGTEMGYDMSAVPQQDPYAGMDDGQRNEAEEEARQELTKTEEEIATLKQVLASKTQRANELKKQLGMSSWSQWTTDLGQGVANLKDSSAYKDVNIKVTQWKTDLQSAPIAGGFGGILGGIAEGSAYQKTSETFSGVAEKAGGLFGGFAGLSSKIGDFKQNASFKSFEERVGGAVGAVKSKMTGSRSNSTNSFEEALNTMEQQRAQQQAAGMDMSQQPQM